MSASRQDAEGSPPGRVSVRQLHNLAFPTFLQNNLAGGECQDFIMESFNCCTGVLGEMPRVFGSKCHFRLVTGFIRPLISEYLAPEYIYYTPRYGIICSVWSELCVFLMLQLIFCGHGRNGSLRNGVRALLLQILGKRERPYGLWALFANGSLLRKKAIKWQRVLVTLCKTALSFLPSISVQCLCENIMTVKWALLNLS